MSNTLSLPRGKRPTRAAAATAQAINNIIANSKKNVGPALGRATAAVIAGPSGISRPKPSTGIGVKK